MIRENWESFPLDILQMEFKSAYFLLCVTGTQTAVTNKWHECIQFSSLQFSSVAQSCLTLCDPWTAACQASLSNTNSWSLLKLMCSLEARKNQKSLGIKTKAWRGVNITGNRLLSCSVMSDSL